VTGLEGTNLGRVADAAADATGAGQAHVWDVRLAPGQLEARNLRLTPLDADGKPTGPTVAVPGPARVTLESFAPVLADSLRAFAPVVQALAHACAQAARAVAQAFGIPPGLLGSIVTLRSGQRVHVSMVRPGPARGVRSSQRQGNRRRRHRRGLR
jgi:hypothetical protein